MTRRIISLALILIMSVCLLPTAVYADNAISGSCGEGVNWSYEASDKTLTISGEGAMEGYYSQITWANYAPWSKYADTLERIVIKNGVTEIGYGDFKNCTALKTVELPESLTTIDSDAFYGCTALQSLNMPNSVTYIDYDAFEGCENIRRVNIKDLSEWCGIWFTGEYSNPLSHGASLYLNGEIVTHVEIDDKNDKVFGVITTHCGRKHLSGYLFNGCKGLKSVTVKGDFCTISSYAFSNCPDLETVTVSDGVSKIGARAFCDNQSLKTVTLSDGISDIGKGAFENCPDLRKLRLPESLTALSDEVFCNSGIKVLYLPVGVTSISDTAFKYANPDYIYYGGSEDEAKTLADLISGDPEWICNARVLPDHEFESDSDYTCNLCGEIRVDTSKIFTDVKPAAWYKKYVDYTYAYGIFTGTDAKTFSPNDNITRAQFVKVLANLENVDTSNRNVTTAFTDVPGGKWYTPAVKWASENGVVNGVGGNKFDPNANVTREQMCVMLTNYAKFKNVTLKKIQDSEIFADDAKISSWAKDAVYACKRAGVVNGKGDKKFEPKGTGTRAEAATIFTRFHKDYIY